MRKIFLLVLFYIFLSVNAQERNFGITSGGNLVVSDGEMVTSNAGFSGNVYYVRPSGGSYGAENGLSYATAWDGFTNIDWGLIKPSDTLYVCGTQYPPLMVGSSGNSFYQVVIKGNYPSDPGIIDSEDTRDEGIIIASKNYITLDSLTSIDAVVSCFEFSGTSIGIITNNCTGSGSGNQAFQHLNTASATHNDLIATGNIDDGISGHDTATIIINGATITGNADGIAVIESVTCTVTGTTTFSSNSTYDIYANNADSESSAWIDITGATLPTKARSAISAKLILRSCIVSGEINEVSNGRIVVYNTLISGVTDNDLAGNLSLYDSRVTDNFEITGDLIAENTFFSGGSDHFVDLNATSTADIKYCIFKGMAAAKYAIVIRIGITATIDNCDFIGASNVGRGIFAAGDLTTNNNIFTDLDIGYFRSVGTSVVNNSCFYGNSTNVSGTATENDSQTGDPNLTDVANNDFTLGSGSSCIGNGIDLGTSQNDYISTATWGNGTSETPSVTTATQPVSWYIGAYGE